MVARISKAVAPGRDNQLLERLELIAKQPLLAGFTVNREGLAAIQHEIDDRGRLFGFAVFCVEPQRERVRAWWNPLHIDAYLARFKLKTP